MTTNQRTLDELTTIWGDRTIAEAYQHYINYFNRADIQDFQDRWEGHWSSRAAFARDYWTKTGTMKTLMELGVFPDKINWIEIAHWLFRFRYTWMDLKTTDCPTIVVFRRA